MASGDGDGSVARADRGADGPTEPAASDGGPRRDGGDPLADAYRRHAFEYLRDADGAVSVADLAREVVARMADKPADQVSLDEQKRMYTALERSHLPRLESSGLVAHDPGEDTVVATEE